MRPGDDEAQIDDSGDRCKQSRVHSIHQYFGSPAVIFSKGRFVHPEGPDKGDSDHEIGYGTGREPRN